jgi:hypothetical protein
MMVMTMVFSLLDMPIIQDHAKVADPPAGSILVG